jgi:hypothetical protein
LMSLIGMHTSLNVAGISLSKTVVLLRRRG